MKWLSRWWWRYLLKDDPDLRRILCRARGHAGPVWYTSNPEATSPDMHCKNCGEDLG